MSYIRQTQDGSYVEIPGGSNYYLYDNGNDIAGWSYGEFAAIIGSVTSEIGYAEEIQEHFIDHFGGWDNDYDGCITRPERAEIFCQCVDRRIDGTELTDTLHQKVQDWADEFDAMRECEYCGEEVRPALYNDDTPYVCGDSECQIQSEADTYGLSVAQAKKARSFEDFDDEWAYIVEHSDREDLE